MTTTTHDGVMHTPSSQDRRQIDAYLATLRHRGRAASTIETYERTLTLAARELPGGLRAWPEEIEKWLDPSRLSRNTRACYHGVLRRFYRWAVDTGRLAPEDNPVADDEPLSFHRGRPRPVPLDQLRAILERAREPERAWMLIAAYTGARCCEFARLRREDITPDWVHIHGKGDKPRQVPTHRDLLVAADRLPDGLICGGLNRRQVSREIARECDMIAQAQGRPELGTVTAHRLRHTAATVWQRTIRDPRVVQELLGHADLATLQVYTGVDEQRMRQAVAGMPTLTGEVTGSASPPGPAAGRNQRPF